MLWAFPTSYKRAPVRAIHFILTKLKNEQKPCRRIIVDEYGALENSTDVTNLLVEEFNISMENTGDGLYWFNVNN